MILYFNSEIMSFVKKKNIKVDRQINRSRGLGLGPGNFDLLAYLHLVIDRDEW
jgi:hypothetical protein